MSTVAGLDLSLRNSGIAVLTDGRPTLLRSVGHGGHNGASYRHRSLRVRSQTRAVMDVLDSNLGSNGVRMIDLAVIEGPEAFDSFGHAFDRGALWHGVFAALDAKHVPIVVINPTTLKAWTTGKTRSKIKGEAKREMLAEVRTWWPGVTVANDDIADALALACVGAFHLGEPMPFEVRARHESSLEKVEWPSRDETNNPVVSKQVADGSKNAQRRSGTALRQSLQPMAEG